MPSNVAALSRLLIAERPRLLRLIRSLGGGRDVEDIVQSLWERVQSVKDHPPILDKKAYLSRLAINQATRHLTQDQRRDTLLKQSQALLLDSDDDLTPERITMSREEIERIDRAIRGLPAEVRQVLVLSRFEGLTQPRIAERLGISLATVERHVRRALDCLAAAKIGEK